MASVDIMYPIGTPTFESESTMFYSMHAEQPVPQSEKDFTSEEAEELLDMLGDDSDDESDDETQIDEGEGQHDQDKYMAQMMGINIDDETPSSPRC